MKKLSFFSASLLVALSTLFLCSCTFGPYPLDFFSGKVDSRASVVTDFSSNASIRPDLGDNAEYSFIVITDVHFGRDDLKFQKGLLKKLETLYAGAESKNYPRFAVTLGDCSNNGKVEEWKMYNEFCDQMKSKAVAKVPSFKTYSCIGNHDCYNGAGNAFLQYVFPNKTAYKFTIQSSSSDSKTAFSYYFLDTANGTLGKLQMNDLKSKVTQDPNPKVFFSHYQIYAGGGLIYLIQDYTERNMLYSLFAKNNTKLVMCGHWHESEESYVGGIHEISVETTMRKCFYLVHVNEKTGEITPELIKY